MPRLGIEPTTELPFLEGLFKDRLSYLAAAQLVYIRRNKMAEFYQLKR